MEAKIPCEIYSRVVGYYRPLQNWNPGKKQEFKERKTYKVEKHESHSKKKVDAIFGDIGGLRSPDHIQNRHSA